MLGWDNLQTRRQKLKAEMVYKPPGGGGGALEIFWWGGATGTMEPLAYTRASSSVFC